MLISAAVINFSLSFPLIESQPDESEEKFTTAAYKIRAAVATAIGATAACAKVLADHEEREMELLMATIIDTQVYIVIFLLEGVFFLFSKLYSI
jgi:SWIRM-associated region 1